MNNHWELVLKVYHSVTYEYRMCSDSGLIKSKINSLVYEKKYSLTQKCKSNLIYSIFLHIFLAGLYLFSLRIKQTTIHKLHLVADVTNFMKQLILLFLVHSMHFLKVNVCSELREIE